MIRYPLLAQYVGFSNLQLKLTVAILVAGLFVTSGYAQLPDFHIGADSITFSNHNPVEGEEITIWVEVKNIGEGTPTMNEDLVVNLYEADPATQPLQILCSDVILELKSGRSDRVQAQWQPPPGKTEIYAVVNPTGDQHIEEANTENNVTHTTLVAETRTFPTVTPEQIQGSITKGITWIKAQQGKHSRTCLQCGTENQLILICIMCGASLKGLAENFIPGATWHFGEDQTQETALALQALFATGHTQSDASVQKGLKFLLEQNWNEFAVYQYAVIIPVLASTQDPAYKERAQFAVNQLVKKQLPIRGSEFADERDNGGWGYGYSADGAHMNMVIYALYAAKQWDLDIPQDTWVRAEKWIRRNQTETGGWLYNLVDEGSPWAIGVYGSMTATGLWALRACSVPAEDLQIQKGIAWVKKHWTLTRNPGSNSWLYYYLLSLQRFCDIPPTLDTLAGYNWYDEISQMMVAQQEPDGRWRGSESDFLATCFAVMSLSHALIGPTEPNIGIVPQSLRFSPPSPRVGEAVRLSATLLNTGTPLNEILNVEFYIDDEKVATTEVLWTPKLGETVVSVDWVPTTEGEIELVARIDLADGDEKDNTASEKLTVYPHSTAATDPQLVKPQKVNDNTFQLGNVVFDTSQREVTIPGEINIVGADSIIEFFACGKLGKTHESILILDAEPFHIFAALGAMDFEPGMNLTVEGDPRPPTGSPVEIWVEWNRGDEVISRRARELIWNAFTEQPMQETSWIFNGGRLVNDQFTPQLFHNIIAVYRDPDSLFNHPLPTGTDDRTYRVNTDVIPPKGTKVKLIIRPVVA
jgi:hypothetical protein